MQSCSEGSQSHPLNLGNGTWVMGGDSTKMLGIQGLLALSLTRRNMG